MFQKFMRKLLNLSERISKYAVAAVLVIVPLLPKFPLIKVTGTYVAIRFEDVLMLFLALLLIPKFAVDFRKIFRDKITASIFLFFAVTFVSVIAGAVLTQTLQIKLGLLHWARRIEYMVPFLVTYLLIPKDKISEAGKFYVKILLIDFVIIFIYGLGQRYFHFPVIITQNEEYSKGIALFWTPGSHINSTFAGHYDLSAFIVLTMPVILALLFSLKDRLSRVLTTVVSAMGLWLLISTVSRTAQATYLFAVTVTLLLMKKYKGWIAVTVVSIVCMFMSSGLDARFTQAIKFLYQKISAPKPISYVLKGYPVKASSVVPPENLPNIPATPAPVQNVVNDVSIAIRYNVEWPRAVRAFLKNPILGTGYSSIDLATDNDYLRMLGETGLLGFFAFVLIILNIGKEYLNVFKLKDKLDPIEKSFLFGLIGGCLGIFATAILIDLFEASKLAIIFWLLLGCAVSMVKFKINEK